MKIKLKRISQKRLLRYIELEGYVKEFADLKSELISERNLGAQVQPGHCCIKLTVTQGSRSPKWKQIVTKLADKFSKQLKCSSGQEYVEKVINNTEPNLGSTKIIVFDQRIK